MLNKYKKDILISILPALILSVTQVLGWQYVHNDRLIAVRNPIMYLTIFILTIIFMVVLIVIGRMMPYIMDWLKRHEVGWLNKISGHEFLIFMGILILCYIPALLAMWPGLYSYDAPGRLADYYDGGIIKPPCPIFHTLILIGCSRLGFLINGTYELGVLIYSILQGLIMSFCFAYALSYIYRKLSLKWISVFGLLFFGLNPIIQMMVFTTTHDIIFGGILLVIMVMLVDSAIDTENFFEGPSKYKNMMLLALMCFLLCLFRNQGIYMLIFTLPFLVIAFKRFRLKVFVVLVIPIILAEIVTGPLYGIFGIQKSDIKEALSLPMQQIGYVANRCPNEITDEQYQEIYRYIPEEYLKRYNPAISDPVKEGFESEAFKRDPVGFFKVWLDVGLDNISSYISAFVGCGYGYYYLGKTPYWQELIYYNGNFLDVDPRPIKRETKFEAFDHYLRTVAKDAPYDKIPVINVLLSQALPFVMMVMLAYMFLLYKKFKRLSILSFPFGYFGTLLLGPVINVRYSFSLIVLVPLLLALMDCDDGHVQGYLKPKGKFFSSTT